MDRRNWSCSNLIYQILSPLAVNDGFVAGFLLTEEDAEGNKNTKTTQGLA